MRNTPTREGRGVDCQLPGRPAPFTRNPEKSNVIAFPVERRREHILLSWCHGFDRYQVQVIRRDGTDCLLASSPDYLDARDAGRSAATGLSIPFVDLFDRLETRSNQA